MSQYQLTQVYLQALFGNLLDRVAWRRPRRGDSRADRADRRRRGRRRDRRHDHLAEDAGRRQQHPDAVTDERGVAAAIVLFPMFAAVVFMFVNGAMWQLDRQVATAAADRASQAVALHGSSVGAARSVAVEQLASAGIDDISVSISRGADFTTVSVSGKLTGIAGGDDGHGERNIGDPDRGLD